MTTLVALTFGLVVWIVVWALGARSMDAVLLCVLIVLPAAAWQVFGPGIKKMLGQGTPETPES